MFDKPKIFTLKRSGENKASDEESDSHSWGILIDKGKVRVDGSV